MPAESEALSDLIKIRDAVIAINEEPTPAALKRMRRHMILLDEASGGRLIRTRSGKRSKGADLLISKTALLVELRTDYAARDAELSALRCQLEGLERRVTGQGRAYRKLGRRVADFENRQKKINAANRAALSAIREMAELNAASE